MIGKVFRIFRERGGILKALDLWDWYEGLDPKDQKRVKYFFFFKKHKGYEIPI